MRARNAIAVLAFSLAGIAAAGAADMRVSGVDFGGYYGGGVRTGQYVIYDAEPGVVVRPYWLAPWQDRHYFPRTGKKPRVGRRENLSIRGVYKPARSFYRSWSNAAYVSDVVDLPPSGYRIAPPSRQEPSLK